VKALESPTPPSKRDRVLLEVTYAGGLRVSELSITGKGGKVRQVLLPAIVSRSLFSPRTGCIITAHWLRHAHGSHAIECGASLPQVQRPCRVRAGPRSRSRPDRARMGIGPAPAHLDPALILAGDLTHTEESQYLADGQLAPACLVDEILE
jgi:hypothetical protein